MSITRSVLRLATLATAASLVACGGGGDIEHNTLPAGVTQQSVTSYTATTVAATNPGATVATQDLLTGGLGKTGIGGATPAYANPLSPTVAELRRNALYANYRGIIDYTANGGYGRLYGPNIALDGTDTGTEGLIPGKEYIATIEQGTAAAPAKVVIAVQIPTSFDVNNPCVVVGPSSGSRGVYGAIASASDWGLKKGCAVALTDGGKGTTLYNPMDDTTNKIDGTRATRTAAGALAEFAANISDAARAAFNTAFPNRLALKQVHSQVNPEKDWGNDTLAAVRYAFYALNEEYATSDPSGAGKLVRFTPGNTMVIAGSVSNGGAAILQAGEQDTSGLIDGVVVGEPSAQPKTTSGYGVMVNSVAVPSYGKAIIDYFTLANLYQPCAVLAPAAAIAETSTYNTMGSAGFIALATNRCNALAAQGLLGASITAANTTVEKANAALDMLHQGGYTTLNDTMHSHLYGLGNSVIIGAMYTTGYGRFALDANMCGTSFGTVDATGSPAAPSATQLNQLAQNFAVANGTANGVPATVIINNSVGGPKSWSFSVSPTSGTADLALDAAVCERALVTGKDPRTGAALTASTTPTLAQSQAVQQGISEVQLTGNLHGKPTVMVAGRHDGLVAINHSERAYTAFNKVIEGNASKLSYVEVENAQHFDTFIPFPGFDTRYVPLHVYFIQGMNSMYAHLKNGTALPASQVVRTTPRGGTPGAAPALQASNVPAFVTSPASADAITFTGTSVNIPN